MLKMLFGSYPKLFEMYDEVFQMLLLASLMVTEEKVPADITAYLDMVSRYLPIVRKLSLALRDHPDWISELEAQIPAGCMAFKSPVVEKFLKEKGVSLP